MVPKSTEIISTKKTKTKILVLLPLKALTKLFDSPIKRTNLSILNTRSNLKALNAVKYCEPTTNREMYFGIVDSKSIIPKKLNIYFLGRFIQTIRNIYSIEKRMVTIHSEIFRNSWYRTSILGTLSSITMIILYKIMIRRMTSNSFPAGVWVP